MAQLYYLIICAETRTRGYCLSVCNGCSGRKPGMWVSPASESIHQRAGSRLFPPENLVPTVPRSGRSGFGLGIIRPCQAREAMPQPAGLAELVLGDRN